MKEVKQRGKRNPEIGRKISETKKKRAAERRAMRPVCLCFCGCGNPLPERVAKSVIYLRNHQPQPDRSSIEFRAKLREGRKRLLESGWEVPKESRMAGARKSKETRLARKAAGKVYTSRGSAGKLKGYKWSPEVVEKRVEPMRGRPQIKPINAKGHSNKFAISGILRSPDNVTYRFQNMTQFVRDHLDLFAPEDVVWYGKHLGHCRALKGLLMLTARGNNTRGSWHGWTLVSHTEVFYNQGANLLSGESGKTRV